MVGRYGTVITAWSGNSCALMWCNWRPPVLGRWFFISAEMVEWDSCLDPAGFMYPDVVSGAGSVDVGHEC